MAGLIQLQIGWRTLLVSLMHSDDPYQWLDTDGDGGDAHSFTIASNGNENWIVATHFQMILHKLQTGMETDVVIITHILSTIWVIASPNG